MGMDFFSIVTEVHPSLDDSQEIPKSISNDTLDRLAKTIHSLQAEKKKRVLKVPTWPIVTFVIEVHIERKTSDFCKKESTVFSFFSCITGPGLEIRSLFHISTNV